MPPHRLTFARRTALFLLCAFSAPALDAAPHGLIVVGLSTSESQAARLEETAVKVRSGLLARGFAPDAITTLAHSPAAPLRRDTILASLGSLAPRLAPDDDTWLVFLGTAAPARDGQPAFQVAGPRLTAKDLASALAALPGKKHVVAATSASGGFLPPLLALPDTHAVAATGDTGEISEPRFAAFWADALVAQPTADFAALAATAAQRVADHYASESLAQGEHARLIDRASNTILQAPFPSSHPVAASAPRHSPPAARSASVDISAIEIPKPRGTDEVERLPADEATRALLTAARASADPEHAATILRTEVELLVASDLSARETWRTRAYLRTGEALDALACLRLPSDPPFVSARLVSARIIRSDGAQRLLNPAARAARLAAEREADRNRPDSERRAAPALDAPPPSFIELPEVTADSIIEAEWTVERRADGTLPEFYDEWRFAERYPQRSLRVTLTRPDAPRWRHFASNLPPSPSEPPLADTRPATGSITQSWSLADLPAHDPFPGDPPARAHIPWLGVSSVASWDDFAAWYRRLAAGSDTAGPGVEALAAAIAAAHPDRAGRLRAAYERVAALRYVAIELGVGAFRPRTPEQVWRQRYGDCKDKVNLLIAVLIRLGIPAEFALVNRFDTTFTDFPGWQFNHALARVPAAPDQGQPHDLWLDTTDRLVPFGVIAPGDLNRPALVFTRDFKRAAFHPITGTQEPAAEWRETYARAPEPDHYRLTLAATGAAEALLRHFLAEASPAQRRERFRQLLAWPDSRIAHLTATDPFDLATPATVTLLVQAPSLPSTPRPLIPGLETHRARPTSLWNEGRTWRYHLTTPDVTTTVTLP